MVTACANCGAPPTPGLLTCEYCKQPVDAAEAERAIPCPACHKLNEWGSMRCHACDAWVVVQCVLCGAVSPHTCPACLSCREPFAGAMERKAARDAELSRQQTMATVSTVGNVAAPFLGALLGAVIEGALDDD